MYLLEELTKIYPAERRSEADKERLLKNGERLNSTKRNLPSVAQRILYILGAIFIATGLKLQGQKQVTGKRLFSSRTMP